MSKRRHALDTVVESAIRALKFYLRQVGYVYAESSRRRFGTHRSRYQKVSGNLSILRATNAFAESDAAATFEVAFVVHKFTSILVNLVRCVESHPLCSLRVRCDVDWRQTCCERADVHVLERRIYKCVEPVIAMDAGWFCARRGWSKN
jgi:hypothetical protein